MTADGFSIFLYIIVVICVLRGFCRGMIKMVITVTGVIITFILVASLAPEMEHVLKEREGIYSSVQQTSQDYLTLLLSENGTPGLEEQSVIIEQLPLPKQVRENLAANNHADSYNSMLADTFAEYLSFSITDIILKILAYVLIFLLVRLATGILSAVILRIVHLPGIRLLDAIGGGVLGIVQGLVAVWLIFLIITLFYGTVWGNACYAIIQQNEIFRTLYNTNVFLYWIDGLG